MLSVTTFSSPAERLAGPLLPLRARAEPAPVPTPTPVPAERPRPVPGPGLTVRWGPSLDHCDPPIEVPRSWRSTVAGLPHDRWVRWRRRASEIIAGFGRPATAAEIKWADRQAAAELGVPGAAEAPAAPHWYPPRDH